MHSFNTESPLEVHISVPTWFDPTTVTLKQGDEELVLDLKEELESVLGVLPRGKNRFISFMDGLYVFGYDLDVYEANRKGPLVYEGNPLFSSPVWFAVGYAVGTGVWEEWKHMLKECHSRMKLLTNTGKYYRERPEVSNPRVQFPRATTPKK